MSEQSHPAIAHEDRRFSLYEAKAGIVKRGEVIQEGHAKGLFVGNDPRGEAWVWWVTGEAIEIVQAGLSPSQFRKMCSAFDLKFPSVN